MHQQPPGPTGLYDPRFEHDACGVSFVANIKGVASRAIVSMGVGALCNLEHRGATGAEQGRKRPTRPPEPADGHVWAIRAKAAPAHR